jgi:hypothetical protein
VEGVEGVVLEGEADRRRQGMTSAAEPVEVKGGVIRR